MTATPPPVKSHGQDSFQGPSREVHSCRRQGTAVRLILTVSLDCVEVGAIIQPFHRALDT
jgi:hypothetical protein